MVVPHAAISDSLPPPLWAAPPLGSTPLSPTRSDLTVVEPDRREIATANPFAQDVAVVSRRRSWVPWGGHESALGPSRATVVAAFTVIVLAMGALFVFSRDSDASPDLGAEVASSDTATAGQPTTSAASAAGVAAETHPAQVTVAQLPPVAPPSAGTVAPVPAPQSATTVPPVPPTVSSGPISPVTTTSTASTVQVAPGDATSPGIGSPSLMSDPLPSGLSAQEVAPALAQAQGLADAFAIEDWNSVRHIDRATAGYSDQAFVDGYRGLDRASLLVADAIRESDGIRLLFVSVANELGGAQTSFYCLQWTANDDGTVEQHGATVGLIARISRTITPEAVRNDQDLTDVITSRCHWI